MIGSDGIFYVTLREVGLPLQLINVIMHFVSSSSLSVLWNGVTTDAFNPSRGIRQGDTLSPYLFVLCMERLGHLINEALTLGSWKPLFLSRRYPPLSYLFFLDDLMLFCEASNGQAEVVNNILDTFCYFFRQKVNKSKS